MIISYSAEQCGHLKMVMVISLGHGMRRFGGYLKARRRAFSCFDRVIAVPLVRFTLPWKGRVKRLPRVARQTETPPVGGVLHFMFRASVCGQGLRVRRRGFHRRHLVLHRLLHLLEGA